MLQTAKLLSLPETPCRPRDNETHDEKHLGKTRETHLENTKAEITTHRVQQPVSQSVLRLQAPLRSQQLFLNSCAPQPAAHPISVPMSEFPDVRPIPGHFGQECLYHKEWLHPDGNRVSTRGLFVAFEDFQPDKDYETLWAWISSQKDWTDEVAKHFDDHGLRFHPTAELPDKQLSIQLRTAEYFMAVARYKRDTQRSS